jgi:hypothetical protein
MNAASLPLPTAPPMRSDLKLAGLLGVAAALATAALFPYLQLLMPDELAKLPVSLPVLALVPTLVTAEERKRLRRNRLMVVSSCAAVLVCSVIVITWKFQAIADWIR